MLALFAVPMLMIAICVRLTSKGKALISQERVGLGGRLFHIYKFRSMKLTSVEDAGPWLTKDGDSRVTALGRYIRKFKLDELPQFYNILRGDMSLVGPRPKLPQYEAMFNMPYRPGITGAATIVFRREEEILPDCNAVELDRFYAVHIKPHKARLDACYMCNATPASDMRIIKQTLVACIASSPISAVPGGASVPALETID